MAPRRTRRRRRATTYATFTADGSRSPAEKCCGPASESVDFAGFNWTVTPITYYYNNYVILYGLHQDKQSLLIIRGVTMHRCIDASRYMAPRYAYRIATQISRYFRRYNMRLNRDISAHVSRYKCQYIGIHKSTIKQC